MDETEDYKVFGLTYRCMWMDEKFKREQRQDVKPACLLSLHQCLGLGVAHTLLGVDTNNECPTASSGCVSLDAEQ